jgi:hypothetical protein
MKRYLLVRITLLTVLCVGAAAAQALEPFEVQWRPSGHVEADVSFLLPKPAGAAGFIGIRDGRLVDGSGKRFRIWGVNLSFNGSFPAKEDAPAYAAHLARYGVNCVRIHHHDWRTPRGLIDSNHADSRHLDATMLDRFDFFVNELKKRGIYVDLNLNVARAFQPGDGVREAESLGFAKAVTIFDARIIELQKEFARDYLTHKNPYTGNEYRHEPAVAIVEILNENSLLEYWKAGRLIGKGPAPDQPDKTWADIPASYAADLDERYQDYLVSTLSAEPLAQIRKEAGSERVPRLKPPEFAGASPLRFQTEARFYIGLETKFYDDFQEFLKKDLGVRAPVVGTSVHNGGLTPYPIVASTSRLDVVDAHTYWQHPRYFYEGGKRLFEIRNTPMLDEPAQSTVMTLSRVAVAGKPFIVSEVNHPYPNEYAAEMIPILAAYGAFHDWDGIFWYSFSHTAPDTWKPAPPSFFDIRNDPVKMAQLAGGALMFLRGDVAAAKRTILRNYTREQVAESLRLPGTERPFFTPGMPPLLALRHATRIGRLDAPQVEAWPSVDTGKVVSDTNEMTWGADAFELRAPRSLAVVGRLGGAKGKQASLALKNSFAAITLHSMDDLPLERSGRLLLTTGGKTANAGMKWNEKRTSTVEQGSAPVLIEPVLGEMTITFWAGAKSVELQPLDGGGCAQGAPIPGRKQSNGWVLPLEKATTWYLVRVTR